MNGLRTTQTERDAAAAELRKWLDKPGPPVALLWRAIHALEEK